MRRSSVASAETVCRRLLCAPSLQHKERDMENQLDSSQKPFFSFIDFDMGHQITIFLKGRCCLTLHLSDAFHSSHKSTLNRLLGIVSALANRLPQKDKDELFRRYFLRGPSPTKSDNLPKSLDVCLSRMDEETQAIYQCPTQGDPVCVSDIRRKCECVPCMARPQPNTG